MSEANPDYREPGIGDFVKCFFPNETLPSEPSRTSHCGMIIDIAYDQELGTKLYTLVHASRELESDMMTDTGFTSLAREISGRVSVSETTDRIVDPTRVAVLPVCAHFFVDLIRLPHVKVLASTTPDTVEKIRKRLGPVNMVALSAYRMEVQLADHNVQPSYPIDLYKTFRDNGGEPNF